MSAAATAAAAEAATAAATAAQTASEALCTATVVPGPGGDYLAAAATGDVLYQTAVLQTAWTLTGPLACGCETTVLDCATDSAAAAAAADAARKTGGNATAAAAAARRKVYLSPVDALLIPAITCAPGDNRTVMRLFTGTDCPAWQADNGYNCSWDAARQLWTGVGCAAPSTLACACLHLTSFSGGAAPALGVASLSAMTSLNPADIFTKLKALAAIIFTLFGAMHLFGAWLLLSDERAKASTLARLRNRRSGYFAAPGGAWLWDLRHAEVKDQGAHVGEEALARVAALMGVPLVRLRAAVPEELLEGCLSAAIGRPTRSGLTPEAVASAARSMLARLQTAARGAVNGGVASRARRSSAAAAAPNPRMPERLHAAFAHIGVLGRDDGGRVAAGDRYAPSVSAASTPRNVAGKFDAPHASLRLSLVAAGSTLRALSDGRGETPRPTPRDTGVAAPPRPQLLSAGGTTTESTQSAPAPAPATATVYVTDAAHLPPPPVAAAPPVRADATTVTSTALVFAFCYVAHLRSAKEIHARHRATSRALARARAGAYDFDTLVCAFQLMLGPGNLFAARGWLQRARLWRLLLLQEVDGGFSASDGLATALLAQPVRAVVVKDDAMAPPRVGPARREARPPTVDVDGEKVTFALVDKPAEASSAPAAPEALWRLQRTASAASRAPAKSDAPARRGTGPSPTGSVKGSDGGHVDPFAEDGDPSCPLSGFSAASLEATVPMELTMLPRDEALRAWATLLAMAFMRRQPESVLASALARPRGGSEAADDGGAAGLATGAATIVDRAIAYLDKLVAARPEVDDSLLKALQAATRHVTVWELRHDRLVARAKAAWDAQGAARAVVDAQRAGAEVLDAVRRGHETFAAFLEPATGRVTRWQRCVLLFTAINLMCVPRTTLCIGFAPSA